MQNYNLKFKNFTFFIVILSFTFLVLNLSVANAAIVPCGTEKTCDSEGKCTITNPCTICHLFEGIDNIIRFLTFNIATPLAVVVLIYGGVMLLISGGDENKLKKGKTALWMAIWGLVIVFAGVLIIDTIIKAIGAGGLGNIENWGPWKKIPPCK